MSTPAITAPEPQIQTTPTPAGTPPVAPVQPRDEQGRFATPPTPTPQTPPAPTPTPGPFQQEDLGNGRIRLKYETGETFEGTPNELLSKVAEAHVNTKRWAQQQRQQPTPPQPVPVQQPEPAKVFATPEEEQTAKYVADLQARYLGFADAETMKREMGFIQQTTESAANRDLSIQFMALQPDFNATPENSEKLGNIVATLVPKDEQWGRMPMEQQLRLMQAAHALALTTKAYTAAPAPTPVQSTSPTPPPPIPTGKAPQDSYAGVPPELVPNINDSQTVILGKIAKLKEMGLWQ